MHVDSRMDCRIQVEVALASDAGATCVELELTAGATVGDAIAASPFAGAQPAAIAIYGELVAAGRQLRDGERVELLQNLVVDPKTARRRRAQASER